MDSGYTQGREVTVTCWSLEGYQQSQIRRFKYTRMSDVEMLLLIAHVNLQDQPTSMRLWAASVSEVVDAAWSSVLFWRREEHPWVAAQD